MIIGTCSQCSGPVSVSDFWGGTVPPVPVCQHCGATKQNPYGPIIPMTNAPRSITDYKVPLATEKDREK